MELVELIKHPERMDRDTLYELRSLLALYPYYQTARLLMLQNLFLLHDPTFDEELRRAAISITDRRRLFQMIEAAHYTIKSQIQRPAEQQNDKQQKENRTISLIENFLDSIPKEEPHEDEVEKKPRRKPTPADAAVDYVAYLLETESDDNHSEDVPQLKGQNLIDSFINSDKGKIRLSDNPEYTPEVDDSDINTDKTAEEGYFTETLARIYIKQGRYSKALEIIQRLS